MGDGCRVCFDLAPETNGKTAAVKRRMPMKRDEIRTRRARVPWVKKNEGNMNTVLLETLLKLRLIFEAHSGWLRRCDRLRSRNLPMIAWRIYNKRKSGYSEFWSLEAFFAFSALLSWFLI